MLKYFFLVVLRRPIIQNQLSLPIGDNGVGCALCKNIVSEIHSQLDSKKDFVEIQSFINLYCQHIPAPYTDICTILSQSYVDKIINSINSGQNPDSICSNLKLCVSRKKSPSNIIRIPTKSSKTCTICIDLINSATDLINQGNSQEEITNGLLEICEKFPTHNSECKTLVNILIPNYVLWLREPSASEKICSTSLSLCDYQNLPKLHAIENLNKILSKKPILLPKSDDGSGCAICHNIINDIINYVTSHKNESEIISLLNEHCNNVPSLYSVMCRSLIDDYVPFIISYVEQGFSAHTICSHLNLCSSFKSQQFIK